MWQTLRALHASTRAKQARQGGRFVWQSELRWLTITALVLVGVIAVLIVRLHPSVSQAAHLLLNLLLSGIISVALAAIARWFMGRARLGHMQIQLALAIVLGVLVTAVNVVLLPDLMFSSGRDVELLLLCGTFGIAVALLVTVPLGGRIARPIVQLDQAARRIASGEYRIRIPEGELGDVQEVAQLARSINEMASGIQHANTRRQAAESHLRKTITAVSHDLRTPLCTIQLGLEAITDGIVSDPTAVKQYHAELLAEVLRLNALVGALFDLTRLESGAFVLNAEPVDIEEVICDVVETTRERIEEGNIRITCGVDPSLPLVSADANKIHRVLTSLLENALRYTSPGGAILLRATRAVCRDQQQAVQVQVIDTGSGIGADDLAHVFEPMYRSEPSRRRSPAIASDAHVDVEVGLGLTLAAHVIQAHGGQIWAASPLPPDARALVARPGEMSDVDGSLPGTMISFTLPTACR